MMTTGMIFDTHAHLLDAAFDEDREQVIDTLTAHGIGGFTEIGCDLPSSLAAVELSQEHDAVYAAVGFHPENSAALREEDIDLLQELTKKNAGRKIVAIGEIGLDYHYTKESIRKAASAAGQEPDEESLAAADPEPEIQKAAFRRMLQLARELQLPINVHSREAAQDTYDILTEEKGYENSGIIHCFGYSAEMAERFVKMGFYIGIGGVVTFKNARKLKEVAERIPMERIVLETDCPFMAPAPHRGTRNDPRNLPYVAAEIAALRGMKTEDVIRITTENAMRVYRME